MYVCLSVCLSVCMYVLRMYVYTHKCYKQDQQASEIWSYLPVELADFIQVWVAHTTTKRARENTRTSSMVCLGWKLNENFLHEEKETGHKNYDLATKQTNMTMFLYNMIITLHNFLRHFLHPSLTQHLTPNCNMALTSATRYFAEELELRSAMRVEDKVAESFRSTEVIYRYVLVEISN